jgi:hypothetical protein
MKLEFIEQPYSLRRLYFLVRNRVLEDLGPVLIVSAAVLALNLLLLLTSGRYNPGSVQSWGMLLAIGGVFLAGNAFSKMHDGKAGTEWILLPASSAEKYSAALVMYLIVYPVFASLIAVLETLIITGIGYFIQGSSLWMYNPVSPVIYNNYLNYAFFVLLAMAGSARFRKFAIGKTAAIIFSFILLGSLLLVLGLLLFDDEGRQILFNGVRGHSVEIRRTLDLSEDRAMQILMQIFQAGTAAFALGYGYALVREKEARDEVQ